MQTAQELHDALKKTGTGQAKLDMIQALIDLGPKKNAKGELVEPTAEEALAALKAGGAPEGTLAKAEGLLAGAKPEDYIGPPPPAQQAADDRLVMAMKAGVGELVKVLAPAQAAAPPAAPPAAPAAPSQPETKPAAPAPAKPEQPKAK